MKKKRKKSGDNNNQIQSINQKHVIGGHIEKNEIIKPIFKKIEINNE